MATWTEAQRNQFEDEGYLVLHDLLDPVRDIQPVLDEYSRVLDALVDELVASGRLTSRHEDLAFADRLIEVSLDSGRNFAQEFNPCLMMGMDVTESTPIHLGPAVFRLITHERVLDLVENLLGPDIAVNPLNVIRMKLPRRAVDASTWNTNISATPWHQDASAFTPEADESPMVTVWLPLNRATVENGTLAIIPKTHSSPIVAHCPDLGATGRLQGAWIPERTIDVDDAVPVPLEAGGAIIFRERLIHCSLDNTTQDQLRLSLDLRYQRPDAPTGHNFGFPPCFVARSATRPEIVLDDPREWARLWLMCRAELASLRNPHVAERFDPGAPECVTS